MHQILYWTLIFFCHNITSARANFYSSQIRTYHKFDLLTEVIYNV